MDPARYRTFEDGATQAIATAAHFSEFDSEFVKAA
jgi:hypothetical protein